jgi:hypothetical protein
MTIAKKNRICEGRTTKGGACRLRAEDASDYCRFHKPESDQVRSFFEDHKEAIVSYIAGAVSDPITNDIYDFLKDQLKLTHIVPPVPRMAINNWRTSDEPIVRGPWQRDLNGFVELLKVIDARTGPLAVTKSLGKPDEAFGSWKLELEYIYRLRLPEAMKGFKMMNLTFHWGSGVSDIAKKHYLGWFVADSMVTEAFEGPLHVGEGIYDWATNIEPFKPQRLYGVDGIAALLPTLRTDTMPSQIWDVLGEPTEAQFYPRSRGWGTRDTLRYTYVTEVTRRFGLHLIVISFDWHLGPSAWLQRFIINPASMYGELMEDP